MRGITSNDQTNSSEQALRQELDQLPAGARALLEEKQFDREWFLKMAARLRGEGRGDNRVTGTVTAPTQDDVRSLPPKGSPEEARLRQLGEEALRRGEVALVVLAGGMATRMGGVIKALVEALPGKTFLDLRLREAEAIGERHGKIPPLWLMASHTTEEATKQALVDRHAGPHVAVFRQFLSLRLNPDGSLYLDDDGEPDVHAPGHGDLPDALQRSGLLRKFVDGGGKLVMVTNLDNLGGGLDPVILGYHLDAGHQVTCEVVDKVAGDRGGIPARLDGKPVVLEEFRLPEDFDPTAVPVFNVNTFTFDAKALADLEMEWTYFIVEKKAHGKPVIQFERLINEVTFHLDTTYLRVPRTGAASRFLPVKDYDELAERRNDIAEVARVRHMLPE